MKTHYELLRVRRKATLIEIEQGYRRILDRHLAGGAQRPLRRRDRLQLQNVRDAFLVLSSPARRQSYDRQLAAREQRRGRILDIGGAILAVASLLAGLLLMGGSAYLREHDAAQAHVGDSYPAPSSQPASTKISDHSSR